MNELIVKMKKLYDELGEISVPSNSQKLRVATELHGIAEHVELTRHHLQMAINMAVVIDCIDDVAYESDCRKGGDMQDYERNADGWIKTSQEVTGSMR